MRPFIERLQNSSLYCGNYANGAVGQKYERIRDRKFYRGLYFNGPY